MKTSKFDKLFNIIMEEVKSSKKHVIKEDIDINAYRQNIENWQNEQEWIIELIKAILDEEDTNKVGSEWNLEEYAKEIAKALNEKGYNNTYQADNWISNQVQQRIGVAEEELGFVDDWDYEFDWVRDIIVDHIKDEDVASQWDTNEWAQDLINQLNEEGIDNKDDAELYILDDIDRYISRAKEK